MSFIKNLHPKVAAGALAAVAANLATVAGALSQAASWWEAALLILAADGPLVVAWIKRADPTVGAVVGALEPVLEEKLREHVPVEGPAVLSVAPDPEPLPALALAPEPHVSPSGSIINST